MQEKAEFSMSKIGLTLDKLYVQIIKVGPVAHSPKIQKLLGCLFALISAVAHCAESAIDGSIGFISNQLDTRVGDVPGNRFIGDSYFDYKKLSLDPDAPENKDETPMIKRRLSLAAQINDQSLLQYSVQEAYVSGKLSDKDFIKFGRHVIDWSILDSSWGFGKINNRRNFNFFEPGYEGLTGLSYEHKGSNGMRYKVFASGLYIPEVNPPYDINKSNKTIKCRSPWCDAPATSTTVDGDVKPIEYSVKYPSISDVIFRYSFGFNIGWENQHWSFDNFYLRKPENNLTTEVTVALDPFRDVVKANIDPQVYYQDIVGSSLKYRNEDLLMYVSTFASRPSSFPDGDRQATEWTEIKTAKVREDYAGAGIQQVNADFGMGLSYVARLSPFNRNKAQLAQDPRWNQALNVFMTKNFGKLTLSGDAKYDMLTFDRLVMLRAAYNLTKSFMVNLGMNMIGTPSDGESYWSPYTNNDQVYAGLRYVF